MDLVATAKKELDRLTLRWSFTKQLDAQSALDQTDWSRVKTERDALDAAANAAYRAKEGLVR